MMWSKLFHWKAGKNDNQQPQPTPAELVRLALAEMDTHINTNKLALNETRDTQIHIQEKLKAQITALNTTAGKAEAALKKNDELTARNLLAQKNWQHEQAQQYQNLLEQLAHTIQQLEKQVAILEMRKIEIQTKETILTAQLQKATSQKEMQSYLGELDKTLGFDSYAQQIETISLENQLANDLLAFDEALENAQPAQTISQLQNQLAQEQRAEQEKKMNTIFTRYFDATKTQTQDIKKTQDFEAMRQNLLHSFFLSKQTQTPTTQITPPKNNAITDFFAQDTPKEQPNKQKQINDFFGNT